MKRYILALLTMIALGGTTAKADTTLLTAADGWTKITTVPSSTDIANNYYVFVDASNDLMLGIGKGVENTTQWYSLALYYRTSVSPTSKDITPMVWTLETQDNGFAMRNLDQPVHVFQTEWKKSYFFDTNDVTTPNAWAKILLAFDNGTWTIQNGYYPNDGYLGPWSGGNFTNGAECAANKSGDNVGKFHIYAISRAQFKQNLLDNASSSNPVDLTPFYVNNPTFDGGNRTGWTEEGSGGNNNTHGRGGGCEIWHRSSFNIHQDLTVPSGKYKVSLQMAGTSGAGKVYGTSNGTTKEAASSAAGGSNFQNTILSMIQDRTFGQTITDEITVSNGSLTIGMKCETTDQWINFDNFKLYCTGVDLSAYQSHLTDLVQECNDFITSGVVPEACENAISSAITTYNKSYETAKQYSTAIVALTAVLDTYRNDTDLKNAYAAFYAFKTKIETLKAGQSSSTELTTFNNAITNATNEVEAATTAADIDTQTANLRSAGLNYISSVEGQFDITFLASQLYSDWKRTDGSNAGIVADQYLANRPAAIPSFAENFEWTAATTGNVLYQTVSDLPAGYYQVGMYTMALSTSQRDNIATEATEGDADRSFAFAGDLTDNSSIQRTGMPIKFATAVDFSDLTTLDVNVHLSSAGNLTFGVQKDANGSNWHFAQIASIVYSNAPDLTNLKATRDALVSEAEGLLASADADFLTDTQKAALQDAIDAGNDADDFDNLNTVTLTTLPNAINAAKQQIQQVKQNRVEMIAALERFENDYNLADGTDYRKVTMSADAWATLITKVNAVSTALDDVSQASSYSTVKNELVAQMDATDTSLRLFKSYKAMVDGTTALNISEGTTYAADSYMDTDAKENEAITALNTAFGNYANEQSTDFSAAAFLGENLDFSAAEGDAYVNTDAQKIYDIAGWEESYANTDNNGWVFIRTADSNNSGKLYLRTNWQTTIGASVLTSKQKMLPVGKYKLTLSWNSNMANMTNQSQYKIGSNDVVAIGQATSEAETLTYAFEVNDNAKPFDLQFGFVSTGKDGAKYPAEILVDDITLTYLKSAVSLANNADNSQAIAERAGIAFDVTLSGRTLYKDGAWNTLCLPFDLSSLTGTPLEGATLMELDTEAGSYEHKTGLDGTTLYLNFKTAESIVAGKPYIIKWASGDPFTPVFNNVTLVAGDPVEVKSVESTDGSVSFIGTYGPVALPKDDKTNLFLGADNTLNWPSVDNYKVNAFRAYFKLNEKTPTEGAREFVLNFGDDTTTGIDGASLNNKEQRIKNQYFDLSGRKLDGRPSRPGIYMRNGQKVIIK